MICYVSPQVNDELTENVIDQNCEIVSDNTDTSELMDNNIDKF